jgi:hypothetical protein
VPGGTLSIAAAQPLGCGSFSDCGPTEHRGEVVAHEGIAQLKVALPVLADRSVRGRRA